MRNESPCLADGQVTDASNIATGGSRFDYSGLDPDTRAQVQVEVRAIHQENADNIGARSGIGRRLITLKHLVGRIDFQPLVKAEYGWGKSTTTNYMNVARVFPDL